ncbi:hypothetical protein BDN70DRAFT_494433 [Pholiota conissans]|uniref:Uncharacterized protein n=1 Tax=Pholiota conissans TaxID=109636 RepID=A0A9P5YNR1_9AGAR|nr:hypothetical protein BDN70DRAFT_494433 [Pholiota conissans]
MMEVPGAGVMIPVNNSTTAFNVLAGARHCWWHADDHTMCVRCSLTRESTTRDAQLEVGRLCLYPALHPQRSTSLLLSYGLIAPTSPEFHPLSPMRTVSLSSCIEPTRLPPPVLLGYIS